MACNKKITQDILFDCADMPKKGLAGGSAVIINYDDIDRASTTVSGATITDLQTTNTGYKLEWYKELASVNTSFSPNTEDVDGFLHQFLGRLSTTTAENAERASELKAGKFVVIVETNYKGDNNTSAYKVYGFENGLSLSELTQNSLENSGSILFTLASQEGSIEPYPYNVFLETDYATSKATFDSLFANV